MDKPPRYIRVSDSLQCRFIENGWHLVTLKPLPSVDRHLLRCDEIDILLKRYVATISPCEAQEQYGAEVYAWPSAAWGVENCVSILFHPSIPFLLF